MYTPKVLIQNQGPLGGAVEQVELDSNRVNVQTETSSRFANFIAISSRGLWVDLSQWLSYSAGFFSLIRVVSMLGVPMWALDLFGSLPLVIFLLLIIDIAYRRKSLRVHAFIRFMLLLVGGVIAVV